MPDAVPRVEESLERNAELDRKRPGSSCPAFHITLRAVRRYSVSISSLSALASASTICFAIFLARFM